MQSKLNCVPIKFEFEFSSVNQRIMTLDLRPHHPFIEMNSPGIRIVEFVVNLPVQINFLVSGKQQDQDTIIDDQGNIQKDLFVKLNNLWLDNIMVPSDCLNRVTTLHTSEGQTLNVSYWGFNGMVTLNLDQNNVFDQIMVWNKFMHKKSNFHDQ